MSEFFSFLGSQSTDTDLPEIYSIAIAETDFINTDVQNIYSRIITDVLERTDGLSEKYKAILWDNCLGSEKQDGLVTMISKAMVQKSELYMVFDKAIPLVREAKAEEKTQIREDYKKAGESKKGIYITFANYKRTDMIKLYSGLEYSTVASLGKQMNLSKAIQIKISELRSSTSLKDKQTAKSQAKTMATALKEGRDIVLDAKDFVETSTPDLTATQAAMDFIASKQSFYLGLPASWITGDLKGGIGDTGKSDQKAVERGLRGYFFSIVKPVVEALFGSTVTYKSEDFQMIDTALNLLKTFEVTSDELLSQENKNLLVNKAFGLPADAKGDPPDENVIDPNDPNNANPNGLQPKKGQQPGQPAGRGTGAKPDA
jgi:hypothetical protein